jgi:hypothetical protein
MNSLCLALPPAAQAQHSLPRFSVRGMAADSLSGTTIITRTPLLLTQKVQGVRVFLLLKMSTAAIQRSLH